MPPDLSRIHGLNVQFHAAYEAPAIISARCCTVNNMRTGRIPESENQDGEDAALPLQPETDHNPCRFAVSHAGRNASHRSCMEEWLSP